jgi:CheY-like chemotaxis protein
LSISKELLKLMEGELNVQSEKGQGSQFMFTAKFEKLSKAEMIDFRNKDSRPATPTIDGVGTLTQTRKHARKTTKRRFTHIVAAEDNALNRKILAKYLQRSENLVLVNDGQQAVDYYQEHAHEIDIMIMDQEMPMLDGRQATMAIREYEKELEVADSKVQDQSKLRNGPGERRKRKEWSHRVPIIALSGNVRTEQIAEAKAVSHEGRISSFCSES